MTIFNVFSLLGGLALFLFGMDIMGKALESFFAHEAGYRLCGTWLTNCEGEQSEEENLCPISLKQEEKDFTLSWACALAVTIL